MESKAVFPKLLRKKSFLDAVCFWGMCTLVQLIIPEEPLRRCSPEKISPEFYHTIFASLIKSISSWN